MDEKTERFIESAQKMLEKPGVEESFGKDYVRFLKAWSKGQCHCGNPLEVTGFEKTGSGTRWKFKCGHALTAISLEETVNMRDGYSASSAGNVDGRQKVSVRIGGIRTTKEAEEISITKLLCYGFKPTLSNFKSESQDSPVDVIGSNGEEQVFFQVTKLYEPSFWKKLSHANAVDVEIEDLPDLIKKAISRKTIYPRDVRKGIVLVIDARPGISEDFYESIYERVRNLVEEVGFSEIWIAGAVPELSWRLYPRDERAN